MHLLKTLLSLSAFVTLACYAAPLADIPSSIDVRDYEDDFDMRDIVEEFDEFERRGKGYTPVPNNARFKTATNTYTGKEVNRHAKELLQNVKSGNKVDGYPKQGSGFRKTEAHADPAKGAANAFHAPIKNSKSDLSHGKVGPDRVVVSKRPGQKKFTADVAFHDPKKPIPKGTGSQNHPFTAAKVKHVSKNTQGRQDKAKAQAKPAKAPSTKAKPPSKGAQKKQNFAKHSTKMAQKHAGKKPAPAKKATKAKANKPAGKAPSKAKANKPAKKAPSKAKANKPAARPKAAGKPGTKKAQNAKAKKPAAPPANKSKPRNPPKRRK